LKLRQLFNSKNKKVMRVVVCCKGIPIEPRLESASVVDGDLRFGDAELYINEVDAYALETAIALKKKYGAETIALTVGPLRAQEVLHFALAKAIDKAYRIDGETNRPELVVSALLPALIDLHPQIILVGVQSEDWMGGEVGIYLAEALHMSVAYAVVEICHLDSQRVQLKKELGGGRKAELIVKLPAVLCVQSGILPLSYVSAIKRKRARQKPVELKGKLSIEEAKERLSGLMAYKAKEILFPSIEGRAEMITGDREEKVRKLLKIIKEAV